MEMAVDEAVDRFIAYRRDWGAEACGEDGWINEWKDRQRRKERG